MSLTIKPGQIFGLLGPNGAGKTTLIKILATLILPDSGKASIGGFDLVANPQYVRPLIGLVNANERSFFWRLTGRQNLEFFAALWNLDKIEKKERIGNVLDRMELAHKADTPFMKYSTGQQQRLALARALLSDPKILLMDEPTRSLDPVVAARLRKFVRDELAGKQGKTILWCTHNLTEARDVCHRLAIIHEGMIMASGSLEDMQALNTQKDHYQIKIDSQGYDMWKTIGVSPIRTAQNNGIMEFEIKEKEEHIPALMNRLVNAGVKVYACKEKEPDLERIFENLIRDQRSEGGERGGVTGAD
ncbi:MAG: ABC transporter ATP-binding protein [Pseudomonadota bacterium]